MTWSHDVAVTWYDHIRSASIFDIANVTTLAWADLITNFTNPLVDRKHPLRILKILAVFHGNFIALFIWSYHVTVTSWVHDTWLHINYKRLRIYLNTFERFPILLSCDYDVTKSVSSVIVVIYDIKYWHIPYMIISRDCNVMTSRHVTS